MTKISLEYDYTPWMMYDSKGNFIGIRPDAPEEAKNEFNRVRAAMNRKDEAGYIIK